MELAKGIAGARHREVVIGICSQKNEEPFSRSAFIDLSHSMKIARARGNEDRNFEEGYKFVTDLAKSLHSCGTHFEERQERQIALGVAEIQEGAETFLHAESGNRVADFAFGKELEPGIGDTHGLGRSLAVK